MSVGTHALNPTVLTQSRMPGSGLFVIRLQTFIFKLVVVLVTVFVFEESIYGRLPLSATHYLIAKTASEAFLYLFLLVVLMHQMMQGRFAQYHPTTFDLCIVAFLSLTVISTLINDGSIIQALLNVRTMLRYLSIYYIIVLSGWVPTEQQATKFIKILVIIALSQSFLVILQHVAGDSFRDRYFSAPSFEVELSGVQHTLNATQPKLGAGYGTFGKVALLGFYLWLVAVIVAARALSRNLKGRLKWWLAYFLLIVGLYFSYKRAPFLLALLVPLLVARFLGRGRFIRQYLLVAAVLIPIALVLLFMVKPQGDVNAKATEISPAQSLAQLLSNEYWENANTQSRGWMIRVVGRQAFESIEPLGYGPDVENAKGELAMQGGEFGKLVGWGAFDDVYIVAALIYYGPIGVGLLMIAFYFLYRRGRIVSRSQIASFRVVGLALSTVLVLMFLALFVVRLLEFRAFAFVFWVLAGMAITVSRSEVYSIVKTKKSKIEDRLTVPLKTWQQAAGTPTPDAAIAHCSGQAL